VSVPEAVDEAFGHWLAGFIDGEGCFLVQMVNHRPRGGKERPGNYQPRFQLNLRDDDQAILFEIAERTGVGSIRMEPSRKATEGGKAVWQVVSKADCLVLVEILDAYPLRAKKLRDYTLWREAAQLYATAGPGKDNSAVWQRMGELRSMLQDVRTYRPLVSGLPGQPSVGKK
jgi:hypothetical protein